MSSRGRVESARSFDVYCIVESGTTIVTIAPEGTRVKKGDVICTLDSAALSDQLVNQRITTKMAEANFLNAKLMREVAEIAVTEYIEGIYKQDMETLKREVDGLRSAIRKIEERLERTRKASRQLKDAFAAGAARTAADIVAEVDIQDRVAEGELALDRERRALAQAEGKVEVLEKYTRAKMIKRLEGEVKKAKVDELAKMAIGELETSKERKLEKQIAHCTLRAPIDGCVQYANMDNRGMAVAIQEGATVRERQKVVSIIDFDGPLQIAVKVPEVRDRARRPEL